MILLAFAGYALWDSNQIYQAADKSSYALYKPTETNEGKSFQELQAVNPEVFAWLTVYGTNIDYPVTQGHDNMKYVNTNAEGLYSLSGAIFLDCNNSRHFSDFNHIVYGHHMENKVMFGELADFANRAMFDAHRYDQVTVPVMGRGGAAMTKNDMEKYIKRKRALILYQSELDHGDFETLDTVVESLHDFPYTEHEVTIQGRNVKREGWLREMIASLDTGCTRVEEFVNGVDDDEMRVMLRMHYVQGISWPKIRRKLMTKNITADGLRKKAERFLKKF